MRTATTVEASGAPWPEVVEFVVEAEKLGLDACWVAEAWGSDSVSPLGYLAARTHRLRLGSGVIQLGTRTPVAIAQAALTLAEMSQGRFSLGLGSSGPQVIEGLHGVPFARPLARMRETVDIVRRVLAGEKLAVDGPEFPIPLPGGEGRPMRLSIGPNPDPIPLPGGEGRPMRLSIGPNPDIPIYLATLSPRMLALTGEVADGWLGTSFVPEGAAAYFEPLAAGAARAGRTLADLDLCQGAEVAFAADERELATMVAARKAELAFSLGGMGSAERNFYNAAYSRQGWAEVAARVRQLWLVGERAKAAAEVTDDMVLATTLIGTEERVRERLRVWAGTGITTVRLYPAGRTLDERLTTLGRAIQLCAEMSPAPSGVSPAPTGSGPVQV